MGPPKNDLELYDLHAHEWWDPRSRHFRSLRQVKDFHLELLREEYPGGLAGCSVVDLGCGGGLLALPLAELGARVVGLDVAPASLAAARGEACRRRAACSFVRADLRRAPLRDAAADLVLLSDVIEHVVDPGRAVREAGRLLRPGGVLFVNTFDRGPCSGLVVVTLAEGLGLVPRGTHDPRLFLRPEELAELGRGAGLRLRRLQRESLDLFSTLRTWTVHLRRSERGFGYSAFLGKERA